MGRTPDSSEINMLKKQARNIEQSDKIIQFPGGGKNKISPFKLKPKKSLDEFKKTEDAFEKSKKIKPDLKVAETEAETIARMNKQNKDSVARLKKKKEKTLGDMLKDYDGDPDAMAMGGLAGLLGEEPRSEYSGGGGTGAPPITYNDNVDKSGPGPTMPPNTMMNTPAIDPRMLNQGRGSGIFIDPRGLQNGKIPLPTQSLADGGRIGFKEGSSNPFFKLIDKISPLFVDEDGDYRSGLQKAKFALSDFIVGPGADLRTGAEWYNKLDADTQKEIIEEKIKFRKKRRTRWSSFI